MQNCSLQNLLLMPYLYHSSKFILFLSIKNTGCLLTIRGKIPRWLCKRLLQLRPVQRHLRFEQVLHISNRRNEPKYNLQIDKVLRHPNKHLHSLGDSLTR